MKSVAKSLAVSLMVLLGHAAISHAGEDAIRLAVMADMSGPFSAIQGPGDVVAVNMAVEDFGGKVLNKPIKILSADHQNKADIGAGIARRWIDVDKVDVILGLGNSAVALAVQQIARDRHVIDIATSVATSDLTQAACSPYGAHWVFDSYALAKGAMAALTKQGKMNWFFITVDYAFGHAMERDATAMVKAAGGHVIGSLRHPLNAQDYSSLLLQAKASSADVIAFASTGSDLINIIKQASEFNIEAGGKRMVAFAAQLTDVHAIGLKNAQGLVFVEAFYWDQNDETRAWSKRFESRHGRPPTMQQAGIYSAAMHYLKSVKAAGTDNSDAVMAQMRKIKINDFMTKDGWIREDGRVMRDMYLLQVKNQAESKGEWDLLKVVAKVPADEAFRPLSESNCPLVKK